MGHKTDPQTKACDFLLVHRLYKADHHRWKIIKSDYTKPRPPWLIGYNILRGLRALTRVGITNDERMKIALELVAAKRNSTGRWIREAAWPSTSRSSFGCVGTEDKWVTLNALLVLNSIKRGSMKR